MPPSRRRQGTQPSRRPKVAGLRQRPHDEESEAIEQDVEQPEQADTAESTAADPTTEDGVAPPVIGEEKRASGKRDRGRGRATESPVESTAEMSQVPSGDGDVPGGQDGLFNRDFALPVSLVVIAAVLAGLAVWFHGEASALDSQGAAQNQALVDAGKTSEVNGQVSAAVERVFSYSFADTAATENAAKDMLAGKAADQYNQLFGQIKQQAPAQKLVVTVKVVTSGVKMLQGDRAVVLLFLDQTATRTDANQSNAGAAQLTVNAEKRGEKWVITDLNMR